jgi:hypothetical protein
VRRGKSHCVFDGLSAGSSTGKNAWHESTQCSIEQIESSRSPCALSCSWSLRGQQSKLHAAHHCRRGHRALRWSAVLHQRHRALLPSLDDDGQAGDVLAKLPISRDHCDGPEDCGTGQVCCSIESATAGFMGASCVSATSCGAPSRVICHQQSDCPSTQQCGVPNPMPGYVSGYAYGILWWRVGFQICAP